MSWQRAKLKAAEIVAQLLRDNPPGFVRMVVRAMERRLNQENRILEADKTAAGAEGGAEMNHEKN